MRAALLAALLLAAPAAAQTTVEAGGSLAVYDGLGYSTAAPGLYARVERVGSRWTLAADAGASLARKVDVGGWGWSAQAAALLHLGRLRIGPGFTYGEQITDAWRQSFTRPQFVVGWRDDLRCALRPPDSTPHRVASLGCSWRVERRPVVRPWLTATRYEQDGRRGYGGVIGVDLGWERRRPVRHGKPVPRVAPAEPLPRAADGWQWRDATGTTQDGAPGGKGWEAQ